MEDPDATDLRGRVTAALDTVDALLGLPAASSLTTAYTKGTHRGQAPHSSTTIASNRRITRTDVRNMALAMAALTVFVIAMIASYSGAFAKPTLHHLNVASPARSSSSTGSAARTRSAVTQVADADAARGAGLRPQGRRRVRRRRRPAT